MRFPTLSILLILPLMAACSKAPPVDEPVRAVRTITLQAGAVESQQAYAAEIRARTEARLGFRVGGKLVQRLVNVGDVVAAGRVLAKIDVADLQLSRDAAQAALRAAQAQLALSQAEFDRFRSLREQGFISPAELERREAGLKAARAQAEQALAQASAQGRQADYAVLTADAPGVITGVEAEPGMVLGPGTTVLRLAYDGPRDAVFSVPEDRAATMRALLGRRGALSLRPWGQGAPTLPATVREVAASADPTTRTFLVKADIGTATLDLGQTATVVLDLPPAPGVLKLPLPAVFERDGASAVWLVDPAAMTVRPQRIEVTGAQGNLLVVGSGLAPGQVVVSAGVHALTPGQKVRWYLEPGSAAPATAAASR